MAKKRMFSLDVVDTDAFLEMPTSTRLLYYDLGMRADDDGFISSFKKIIRMTGASEDDLRILISKSFIVPFETGVIVIRHWRLNNYIQKDRYTETIYKEEKKKLLVSESNVYKMDTECIHSIDKISKEEISIDKNSEELLPLPSKKTKHKYGEYKNVLLTDEELEKLKNEYPNYEELIKYLDEYIEMKGYKAKSHYLCIKKWVVEAVKEKTKKEPVKSGYPNYDYDEEDSL